MGYLINAGRRRLLAQIEPWRTLLEWRRSVGRYRQVFGHWPHLLRPRTWNEWIQWRKLFDRDPRFAIYADKYAVRAYVAARAGAHVLPTLQQSGTHAEQLTLAGMPERFMLKASHGCRWFLPMVRRDQADLRDLRRVVAGWLRQNFAHISGEWPYERVTPRFLVEEWLGDADGSPPWDYKFYCFGGRVSLVHVDKERFGAHQRAFYSRDWQFRPITLRGLAYPADAAQLPPPPHYAAMLELAETLAADHDFLRVDLYSGARGPIFGELTFFPGSGLISFNDPAVDRELGALWTAARC